MLELLKKKLKKLVSQVTESVKKAPEQIVEKVKYKEISREEIENAFKSIEAELIEADVALEVVEAIKSELISSLSGRKIERGKEAEVVTQQLKESLKKILDLPKVNLLSVEKKPYLIVFLGFNGTGKTTSIAKLAYWLMKQGKSCVIAAADTFRAASIEQLEALAEKLGIKVIKHKYGADPAAVVFDAVKYAEAKGVNFVLADTAGRSHTNKNLMDELKKIVRVNKPDLTVLVIDSLTGSDAVKQAEFFSQVGVDALVFTKLDVNRKGGNLLSVCYKLKKPVLFLGTGLEYEDLDFFDAKDFLDKLLG